MTEKNKQNIDTKPSFSNRFSSVILAISTCILFIAFYVYLVQVTSNMYIADVEPIMNLPKLPKNVHYDYSKLIEKINLGGEIGPEDMIIFNNSIYTSVLGGKILRITDDGQVSVFATITESDCDDEKCSSRTGRPLGMKLDQTSSHLIVIDAYFGLYNISLIDGHIKKICPNSLTQDKCKVTFWNDVVILPNGSLILSEFSTKYDLRDLMVEWLLGGNNGRLLMINPETAECHEIATGLNSPNGVELSSDHRSVLVAETFNFRVLRFPLDGAAPTVFVSGLPGLPDNIRKSPRGGYWIPVSNLRTNFASKFLDKFYQWTKLRYVIGKIVPKLPFHYVMKTDSSMLLRFDDFGNLIEIGEDPDHLISNVASVLEHTANNTLYTASYFLPFIGKLNMKLIPTD